MPGGWPTWTLLPRGRGWHEVAALRHARAERHLLLPGLEQALLPRARRDHPDRAARLPGRRALTGTSILDRIGDTPLVQLRHCVPENGAELWIKLEYMNP